ncbi:MAG: hypothetical protein HY072_05460 [Deltaproteobacteria bacterium]|nr:hypothetical protein [Deltaproteobacteria bacterium]
MFATNQTSWANDIQVISEEEQVSHAPHINTENEPYYPNIRPMWAFEFTGSLSALGTSPSIPNKGSAKVRAVAFQIDFQPPWIQKLGVLSLGPSLQLYPVSPYQGITSKALGSLWSTGGQVKYQAYFFKQQPIVPVVGYTIDWWNYTLADSNKGRIIAKGPILGLMLLLNILEPESAFEFFLNWGIARNYLVAEYRFLSGSDSNISFTGGSIFFGLRFEL